MTKTVPETPYHSFTRLKLTISEPGLDDVRTEHLFELRSNDRGAEVWRSSVLHAGDSSCESEPRLLGWLSTRQVIELLVEIERSGVYEALPAMGIVPGKAVDDHQPNISIELASTVSTRSVVDHAPADETSVRRVVDVIRTAIDAAQERSLCYAG